MAKKKVFEFRPHKYYVYYDNKSGKIYAVSNERLTEYEYGIEVDFNDVEKLITGEWSFSDYIVGLKKGIDGESTKCVMPVIDQDYAFRHNVFEWISPTKTISDFIVQWDQPNKTWHFLIDPKIKPQYEKELLSSRITFFITLENDFDFLIRTIFIDIDELLTNDKVSVPFESKKETNINDISVSSKVVFKSYRLETIYE